MQAATAGAMRANVIAIAASVETPGSQPVADTGSLMAFSRTSLFKKATRLVSPDYGKKGNHFLGLTFREPPRLAWLPPVSATHLQRWLRLG